MPDDKKSSKPNGWFPVQERKRTYVGVNGHRVTELNLEGNWIRTRGADGYVLVNPENVLAIVIEGEPVR